MEAKKEIESDGAELVPSPGTGLAPVPDSVEEERKLATFAAEQNLAQMAIVDPDKVEKALNALSRVLATMRKIAVEDTVGIDWTLYKDRDGKEVGVLRGSGAVKARKWLGISIFNHRPDDGSGGEGPRVYEESVSRGEGKPARKVQVVSGLADGHCARTGEPIQGVYFAVRNEPQEFTGRKDPETKLSNLTDVLSTWRTGIDAKIVRVLGSLTKVSKEELIARGVDVANCYRGRGYGTGSERAAAGAAEVGIEEVREGLRKSIIRRVAGDMGVGKKLVKEITSSPKTAKSKGFAGVESLDRLTLSWQFDKAWQKLRAHKMFGNKALGWPEDAEDPPEDKESEGKTAETPTPEEGSGKSSAS